MGTIDLDLEIPGGGIMSAAGRQACVSLVHCLDFPSAVCTGDGSGDGGGGGRPWAQIFFLEFSSHTVAGWWEAGHPPPPEVVDISVILSK